MACNGTAFLFFLIIHGVESAFKGVTKLVAFYGARRLIVVFSVMWISGHHGMARLHLPGGGARLQYEGQPNVC
jgi:hypothetical protein